MKSKISLPVLLFWFYYLWITSSALLCIKCRCLLCTVIYWIILVFYWYVFILCFPDRWFSLWNNFDFMTWSYYMTVNISRERMPQLVLPHFSMTSHQTCSYLFNKEVFAATTCAMMSPWTCSCTPIPTCHDVT